MALPTTSALLRELDTMTHAQRCRRIVDATRTHHDDPALTHLLDGVAAESNYHHLLVLLAAEAIGDRSRLEAAARHSSARIRAVAARKVPLAGSDSELAELYLNSSARDRSSLRSRLRREGRAGVADLLCRTAIAGGSGYALGDTERAALLTSASADTVAELLIDLADLVPSTASLARAHPGPVLDHLERSLTDASGVIRRHWWRWAGPALPELVRHDSARILALIEKWATDRELPHGLDRVMAALVRRHPEWVAALVTGPCAGGRLPRGVINEFRRFAPADRARIATKARADGGQLAALFGALPPAERTVLHRDLTAVAPLNQVEARDLADVLPRGIRHEVGRWLVERPEAKNPRLLLDRAGTLPHDEAREAVAPYLHSPVAEERAAAHRCLLLSAGADRDEKIWARAVAGLGDLINDQDPVRLTVAEALGKVPVGVAAAGPLEPIGTFVDAVVAARDTSAGTISLLQRHCWRAVRWAAEQHRPDLVDAHLGLLNRLAGPQGTLRVTDLEVLPSGTEQWVIDALLPRITAAMARNDHRLLLSLAHGLGRRARDKQQVQDLLERAIDASDDSTITSAIRLWLDDPATRGDRVETVLRVDRSTITLSSVQAVLVTDRQDLLDRCWSRRAPRGRFWRSFARYVPSLSGRFTRMLPRQVRAYAEALTRLASDPDTSTWQAVDSIARLSRLPDLGIEPLQPFLDSPQVALVEAALAGLPRTKDPRALELLLAHRGTDHARVAAYAVAAAVGHLRPGEATQPLTVLAGPGSKVTAAKEGVRLLGSVRPPGALEALLDVVADDRHRDVRSAQARTLREFLDDERAWQVLGRRVEGSREEAMAVVDIRPVLLPVRHRARYATLVGVAAGRWPELLADCGGWVPWQPDLADLLCTQIADAASPWWRASIDAMSSAVARGAAWPETLRLAEELATRCLEPGQPNAETEQDLPLLRRLTTLCERLRGNRDDDLRGRWAELADTLLPHRAGWSLALDLAVAAVHPDDPAPGVRQLLSMIPDPLAAPSVGASVAAARHLREGEVDALAVAVDAAFGEDAASGLVALEFVRIGGPKASWSQGWRDRLRELRRHPVPVVADAARGIKTSGA